MLLAAGMQAPSGGNQRPWEFLVIDDKEIIKRLPEISGPAAPAGRAPLCIITLGNEDRMKFPELWTHDMGACCQNILLEAAHLGLGAVWMSIDPTSSRVAKTRELFDLPENIKPFSIIAVGYPDEDKKIEDRYDETRIHHNKF